MGIKKRNWENEPIVTLTKKQRPEAQGGFLRPHIYKWPITVSGESFRRGGAASDFMFSSRCSVSPVITRPCRCHLWEEQGGDQVRQDRSPRPCDV